MGCTGRSWSWSWVGAGAGAEYRGAGDWRCVEKNGQDPGQCGQGNGWQ